MAQFTLKIGRLLETPETKKFYNERVFAEIAPRYDFITRALSFWHDKTWKRDLIDALPDDTGPVRCVDLACGTGDIAFLLAVKYKNAAITGIDITEPMLTLARAQNRFPNVSFERQDMCRLSAASDSLDIVTGGYALRNAPDLAVALDEIQRVLTKCGTAAFLDFSKPASPFWQKAEYWLLKFWTGLWGLLLHRNHEVYSYIAESLRAYPDRTALVRMFEARGFEVVWSRLYFLGITQLLVVRKSAF
jgi:demethylmenaquinone methyltransferase/2-methoxy-6-polyprenyl-1,4-benzoquinol methylase